MVPTDSPRKRKLNHKRFLVIALMLLTLSVGTANAATPASAKATAGQAKTVAKKATTSKTTTKKATTTVAAKKTTTTKKATTTKTQVKGEKITANKISVVGNNNITTYTVKSGDTISSIAKKFDISVNTIRWSNDISSKDVIKPGQSLVIMPTSGVIYTVKKGDTLSGIAVKFSADQKDILNANDLDNADSLKVGMTLAIPNAEPLDTESTDSTPDATTPAANIAPITLPVNPADQIPAQTSTTAPVSVVTPVTNPSVTNTNPSEQVQTPGTTMMVTNPVTALTYPITITQPISSTYSIPANDIRGYYAQPVSGRLSQGIHDVNAVDIATPVGTSVHAAANGTVIVAMGNGAYNGGYGNYIVISHPNGTQTLYAHLSSVNVTLGENVMQGQPIALSGRTGKVTGAHLHFEVRGATNPWGSDSLGTTYSI